MYQMYQLYVSPNGVGGGPNRDNGFDVAQLATAGAFLRLLRPTATATDGSPGSYGLKHDAERWGRAHGMAPYVSNGALIAAAVALGLPMRRHPGDSPNVGVGVSRQDLSRLRAEAERLRAQEERGHV